MKKEEELHRYHIHVTSEDKKAPRGFKLTSIILEKKKVIEEHNMFTRTFVGTTDVQRDVEFMKSNFLKMFTCIQRFKIELLNEPKYIDKYTEENYREIHIKLTIKKEEFLEVKNMLKIFEDSLGYSLSNNPKEIETNYISQFINCRFLNDTYEDSEIKLDKIKQMLKLNNINIKEIKDELTIYDTNFTLDRWWAH